MRNIFILFFLVFYSCNNNSAKQEAKAQKSDMNIIQKHDAVLGLEKTSKIKIENWKEYHSVTNRLSQF